MLLYFMCYENVINQSVQKLSQLKAVIAISEQVVIFIYTFMQFINIHENRIKIISVKSCYCHTEQVVIIYSFTYSCNSLICMLSSVC